MRAMKLNIHIYLFKDAVLVRERISCAATHNYFVKDNYVQIDFPKWHKRKLKRKVFSMFEETVADKTKWTSWAQANVMFRDWRKESIKSWYDSVRQEYLL